MKEISIEKIIEILNSNIENLEMTEKQLEESLLELGMDSITFIRIIVEIEETFECEFPDSKLMLRELDTAQKIIDVLQEIYEAENALAE